MSLEQVLRKTAQFKAHWGQLVAIARSGSKWKYTKKEQAQLLTEGIAASRHRFRLALAFCIGGNHKCKHTTSNILLQRQTYSRKQNSPYSMVFRRSSFEGHTISILQSYRRTHSANDSGPRHLIGCKRRGGQYKRSFTDAHWCTIIT